MLYINKEVLLRTNKSFEDSAAAALISKESVDGIKGRSILLDFLELPDGLPIDYMHLINLGVFKLLFDFWFNSTHKEHSYYIGNCIYNPSFSNIYIIY